MTPSKSQVNLPKLWEKRRELRKRAAKLDKLIKLDEKEAEKYLKQAFK